MNTSAPDAHKLTAKQEAAIIELLTACHRGSIPPGLGGDDYEYT
jgi:hypothetical protein